MHVAFETPDQPEVIALIGELDAYLYALYPAESVYALDISALLQPNVLFAVARDGEGKAVGCAAMVINDGYGELKRMFVKPAARGLGAARRVLGLLEAEAAARGLARLALETGPAQQEALALYEGNGYTRCERFGDYPDDPYSIYMHKPLGKPTVT
ncbi:MAG: GNAT family N-acetyltransferase [Gammaproteobacteria bacterium]